MLASFLALIAPQAQTQTSSNQSATAAHGEAIDATPAKAAKPAEAGTPGAAAIQITKIGGKEYLNVDFQLLASFPFEAPNDKLTNDTQIAQVEKQIPASIKALDGKNVMVRGFMVPVKDVQGHTTEFLIVRDQPTCCYSGMTTITEFVSVKVPGAGVESILDEPIIMQGKLHVGAVLESGYVLGVYRMDGEKLADLPKP